MRVIPVIDLLNGHVVRGVAGRRSEYRPIVSQIAADAQPATIARALVEQFGFETVYVADLNAIQQGTRNSQAWKDISDAGLILWLDAGVGLLSGAKVVAHVLRAISVKPVIVVGLESLASPKDLVELMDFLGANNLAFSLDLQRGMPMSPTEHFGTQQPIDIARCVLEEGVERLIVLDLADVGVGKGTGTLQLCRQIRNEFPAIELVAGGGVRGIDDLTELARAGCDAALVASALHDGKLSPADIRGLRTGQ